MRALSKLAKKILDLVEYSDNIIDHEVNKSELQAPEKAARSRVLLHHSHFISKLNN